MALTQSARLPGPSWDETIVPALRKRLESESQTLARRISAISVSSVEEGPSPSLSATSESTIRERLTPSTAYSIKSYQATSGNTPPSALQQPSRDSFDRNAPSSRVNGNGSSSSSKPSSAPPFKRSRTYSQPFASDIPPVPNANVNGNAHPTTNGTNTNHSLPTPNTPVSRSSLSEPKPTRIPKVSRGRSGSNSSHGHPPLPTNLNGYNRNYRDNPYSNPPSPAVTQFPELGALRESSYRNSAASHSTISVPSRRHSGILNEQPPFIPGSNPSSAAPSQYGHSQSNHSGYDSPPRRSTDSEERPFEHWYRGEVSRNGGVGELRVGKRMEMLEIANYGHTLKTKVFDTRIPVPSTVGEGRKRRKRAGSVSGIDTRELDRGSLYLDEERAKEVARVLDEGPLTDLDGEGEWSDIGSSDIYSHQRNFNYMGALDASTASAPPLTHNRSTTPTPATPHGPPSRQQNPPPTRIPGPAPRQSSEPPRMPTPTQMHRGASEPPPSLPSSSSSTPPSPSRHQRHQPQPQKPHSKSTPPPSTSKRPAAPPSASTAAKKSRTAASKATRAKTLATRKQMEEQANRRSVAYYPTPGGGEDMMDAIPSWTQPVPREGNWDEVVLPVVARKKGLDGHYEQANGGPQARRMDNVIEPAPGTFAYNHSKYRPPQEDDEIPMDEFGRTEENDDGYSKGRPTQTDHEETRIPVHGPPGPLSHYPPPDGKPKVQDVRVTKPPLDLERGKNEDDGGGCCKCVIM